MKEHYVSYDCAVKLKELGFKDKCNAYYWTEDKAFECTNSIVHKNSDTCLTVVMAPFLWQAQAWLRDKGIHISLNPYGINPDRYDGDNYFWSFELFQVPTGGWLKVNEGGFDTYELALSVGIDKALELLGG